jgi:hypothetical protein
MTTLADSPDWLRVGEWVRLKETDVRGEVVRISPGVHTRVEVEVGGDQTFVVPPCSVVPEARPVPVEDFRVGDVYQGDREDFAASKKSEWRDYLDSVPDILLWVYNPILGSPGAPFMLLNAPPIAVVWRSWFPRELLPSRLVLIVRDGRVVLPEISDEDVEVALDAVAVEFGMTPSGGMRSRSRRHLRVAAATLQARWSRGVQV